MDEPWEHYAKWNKPDAKGKTLYDSTYMRYKEQSNSEKESRITVARGWGEEEIRSYYLMGTEFPVRMMEKS